MRPRSVFCDEALTIELFQPSYPCRERLPEHLAAYIPPCARLSPNVIRRVRPTSRGAVSLLEDRTLPDSEAESFLLHSEIVLRYPAASRNEEVGKRKSERRVQGAERLQ